MEHIVEPKIIAMYEAKAVDISFRDDYRYETTNPYHFRLEAYTSFVLRDDEGEKFCGRWNQDVFKKQAPLHVEVGSGHGHFLREFCAANPDVNFVGIDYKFKRTFELAKKLQREISPNFRFLRAKGERLAFLFAENEVDCLHLYFPDPWPKKRHNKHRLFAPPFLDLAFRVLKPGGKLLVKTDHDGYFEWMKFFALKDERFHPEFMSANLRAENPEHPLASFTTKFERIFIRKGTPIKAMELISKKVSS